MANDAEVIAGIRWFSNALENCALQKYITAKGNGQGDDAWASLQQIYGIALLLCEGENPLTTGGDSGTTCEPSDQTTAELRAPMIDPDGIGQLAEAMAAHVCGDCGMWRCCDGECKPRCTG